MHENKRILLEIQKDNSFVFEEYGLLSGSTGHLLLLFSQGDYDNLYVAIEKTLTIFENQKDYSILYSSGMSGLLWTMSFINQDRNIDYLDNVIEEFHKHLINSIHVKLLKDNFDFLHGYTGIIHSVVDFFSDDKTVEQIINYLHYLKKCVRKTETGLALEFYNYHQKEYSINYSLSHGMSAVIQVLSRIFKKGISVALTRELLNGMVEFVLNNKNDFCLIGSHFPDSYESINTKSRLAWCYGDLGIAIAIWQAGFNTGNTIWCNEAESILKCSTLRRTTADTKATDPMLCHGTSGIATIYNRMWYNTNDVIYRQSRDFWLEETKKFARFNDGVAGYKYYNPKENVWTYECGFLEGAIGLSLAFLSAESENDISWDRSLLISS
jgi:lantibiotic modifying enzyme